MTDSYQIYIEKPGRVEEYEGPLVPENGYYMDVRATDDPLAVYMQTVHLEQPVKARVEQELNTEQLLNLHLQRLYDVGMTILSNINSEQAKTLAELHESGEFATDFPSLTLD